MPDAHWRTSTVDSVLIRLRLESFVRTRFGSPGTGRLQAPIEQSQWRNMLDAPDLVGFVWSAFDDAALPRAVGLRFISDPRRDAVYEVAEWHGPQDIRRSRWRHRVRDGWTQVTHAERRDR